MPRALDSYERNIMHKIDLYCKKHGFLGCLCLNVTLYAFKSKVKTLHLWKPKHFLETKFPGSHLFLSLKIFVLQTLTVLVITWIAFSSPSPIPTLRWYKIDPISNVEKKIEEGNDFRFSRFNQFLTIRNVDYSKAGNYKCEAENRVGITSAIGRIKVAGKYLVVVCVWTTWKDISNVVVQCR